MVYSGMQAIEEMIEDIKRQLDSSKVCTAFGEPQAFIELGNGRLLEVVLEKEGLEQDEWFYSATLHCSDVEFDNGRYENTVGVIGHYCACSFTEDDLKYVVAGLVEYNEYCPVDKDVYMENAAKLVDAGRMTSESAVVIGLDCGEDGRKSVFVDLSYGDEDPLSPADCVFEEAATEVNIAFAKELQGVLAEKFGIISKGEIAEKLDSVIQNAEGSRIAFLNSNEDKLGARDQDLGLRC